MNNVKVIENISYNETIGDAGQPTTHFNVLRERGMDTGAIRVDKGRKWSLSICNDDWSIYYKEPMSRHGSKLCKKRKQDFRLAFLITEVIMFVLIRSCKA